jgi:hypothetical protein
MRALGRHSLQGAGRRPSLDFVTTARCPHAPLTPYL